MKLSDKMRATLLACVRDGTGLQPWDRAERLRRAEGIAYKQAVRRLEKASAKGLIEFGVSIHGAWLTVEGERALQEMEEGDG